MESSRPASAFAVSTWSVHRLLGVRYAGEGADRTAIPEWGPGDAALLDIPAQAAARGIGQIEICHFHFPSTDPGYLADLRGALAGADVRCLTLLIDEGDITNPDPAARERDIAAIRRWIAVAGELGAARVRVIAGDSAPDPAGGALRLSADTLRSLAAYAGDCGVRVVTENWHALLDRPAEVLQLFDLLDGRIGLLLDFGNWHGDRKYADLPQIAHLTESTHAKANYLADGALDTDDYARCLSICRDAGFTAPHSLIFDSPGDEWEHIEELRDFVNEFTVKSR